MSEQAKYNVSNALGIGAKAVNAVATGNYTGIANTLTNSLVNQVQRQALKSANGTVVGYVMNELGNLGYVNGTQSKGPIQTASFAGSLINAATTAVTSPVSFATSLAGNALGTFASIDGEAAINNAKATFNTVATSPSQITNGLANSIGNAINSIGSTLGFGTSDSTTPTAPAQAAGTAYNPTSYFDTGSSTGSSSGTSIGTGSNSVGSNNTPSSPSYAQSNSSAYSSSNVNINNKYEWKSYNSTDRLQTNNSDTLSEVNTQTTDEFAHCSPNANDSTGRRSLVSFLNHINDFGVQLQNNFEVEFTGLDGLTMFVTTFELPGSKQNTTEIFYDGIKITIPINYDIEHEFTMTIMNDARGFIYSAVKGYIEMDSFNHLSNPKTSMIIRALTGQLDSNYSKLNNKYGENYTTLVGDKQKNKNAYCGSRIIAQGVRFTNVSGLNYGQNLNEIQTFTVNGTMISYSHLPTTLSKTK